MVWFRRSLVFWMLGIALLQAAWIVTVPPFRGIDEIDHAFRAASVADGQWRADTWSRTGRGLEVEVPSDLVDAARAQCLRLSYMQTGNCNPPNENQDEVVTAASGAGLYHPAFYWLVGKPTSVLSGDAALFAMRGLTAFWCLILLGLAASQLMTRAWPWSLSAFTVGLTPVVIYSTTVVAPNGLEMAAGAAVWTGLLRAMHDRSRRAQTQGIAIACTGAVLLVTLRLLGPLFLALIIMVLVIGNAGRTRELLRSRRGLIAAASSVVIVASTMSLLWIQSTSIVDGPPDASGSSSLDISDLIVWNLQMIAAAPLRDNSGPILVYLVYASFIGAMIFVGLRMSRSWQRLSLLFSLSLTLGMPIALTLLTQGEHGAIWQGRYQIAFAVGVVIQAGIIMGREFGAPRLRTLTLVFIVLCVSSIASLLKVREDELNSVSSPFWWVVPAPLQLLLCSAAWVLLALACRTLFKMDVLTDAPSDKQSGQARVAISEG